MPDQKDFGLEGLKMPSCFTDPAALARIKKHDVDAELASGNYERCVPDTRHDIVAKDIDGCIYRATLIVVTGLGMAKLQNMQFERMAELFGVSGRQACLHWIEVHDVGDPDVCEALVCDAIAKNDPWQLPDELLAEYEKRVGTES